MPKKTSYTQVNPLPRQVPRQLAIDMLHSHSEYIELNPLVTGHRAIPVPRDAAADEYFAQWHEIDEVVPVGLGVKKKISFKGVFHDMPWGLQTHTYGPLGIDLRIKWQVKGNQPGEPPEPRELGLDTPRDGLYLRADVDIICNITLAGIVKKEMKAAATVMVDRLTRKAELLDQGQLQAMFEDGKLKTINPAQEAHLMNARNALKGANGASTNSFGQVSPPPSPMFSERSFESKAYEADPKGFGNYYDVARANSSRQGPLSPPLQQQGFGSPDMRRMSQMSYSNSEWGTQPVPQVPSHIVEAPGNYYHPQSVPEGGQAAKLQGGASFTAELPGNDQFLSPSGHRTSHPNSDGMQNLPYNSYHTGQSSPSNRSGGHTPPAHPLHHTQSQELPAEPVGYRPYNPPSNSSGGHTPPLDPHRRRSSNQQFYQPYTSSQGSIPTVNEEQRWSTAQIRESLPSVPPLDGRRSDAVPAALRPRSMSAVNGAAAAESGNVKCPVCKNFEGDETAVSHHVSTHFQ